MNTSTTCCNETSLLYSSSSSLINNNLNLYFTSPISSTNYIACLNRSNSTIQIQQAKHIPNNIKTHYSVSNPASNVEYNSIINCANILDSHETIENFTISNTQLLALLIHNSSAKQYKIHIFAIRLKHKDRATAYTGVADLMLGSNLSDMDYKTLFEISFAKINYFNDYSNDYRFECTFLDTIALDTLIDCLAFRIYGALYIPELICSNCNEIVIFRYEKKQKHYKINWRFKQKFQQTNITSKLLVSGDGRTLLWFNSPISQQNKFSLFNLDSSEREQHILPNYSNIVTAQFSTTNTIHSSKYRAIFYTMSSDGIIRLWKQFQHKSNNEFYNQLYNTQSPNTSSINIGNKPSLSHSNSAEFYSKPALHGMKSLHTNQQASIHKFNSLDNLAALNPNKQKVEAESNVLEEDESEEVDLPAEIECDQVDSNWFIANEIDCIQSNKNNPIIGASWIMRAEQQVHNNLSHFNDKNLVPQPHKLLELNEDSLLLTIDREGIIQLWQIETAIENHSINNIRSLFVSKRSISSEMLVNSYYINMLGYLYYCGISDWNINYDCKILVYAINNQNRLQHFVIHVQTEPKPTIQHLHAIANPTNDDSTQSIFELKPSITIEKQVQLTNSIPNTSNPTCPPHFLFHPYFDLLLAIDPSAALVQIYHFNSRELNLLSTINILDGFNGSFVCCWAPITDKALNPILYILLNDTRILVYECLVSYNTIKSNSNPHRFRNWIKTANLQLNTSVNVTNNITLNAKLLNASSFPSITAQMSSPSSHIILLLACIDDMCYSMISPLQFSPTINANPNIVKQVVNERKKPSGLQQSDNNSNISNIRVLSGDLVPRFPSARINSSAPIISATFIDSFVSADPNSILLCCSTADGYIQLVEFSPDSNNQFSLRLLSAFPIEHPLSPNLFYRPLIRSFGFHQLVISTVDNSNNSGFISVWNNCSSSSSGYELEYSIINNSAASKIIAWEIVNSYDTKLRILTIESNSQFKQNNIFKLHYFQERSWISSIVNIEKSLHSPILSVNWNSINQQLFILHDLNQKLDIIPFEEYSGIGGTYNNIAEYMGQNLISLGLSGQFGIMKNIIKAFHQAIDNNNHTVQMQNIPLNYLFIQTNQNQSNNDASHNVNSGLISMNSFGGFGGFGQNNNQYNSNSSTIASVVNNSLSLFSSPSPISSYDLLPRDLVELLKLFDHNSNNVFPNCSVESHEIMYSVISSINYLYDYESSLDQFARIYLFQVFQKYFQFQFRNKFQPHLTQKTQIFELESLIISHAMHSQSAQIIRDLTCNSSSILLNIVDNNSITYSLVKSLGCGYWLYGIDLLNLIELCAKNQYLINKNPNDALLFYLLSGKLSILLSLIKQNPKYVSVLEFMSLDFASQENKSLAAKNALRALSLGKYEVAIAFFLLSDMNSDAINIAIRNLKDPHLAIIIAKLRAFRAENTMNQESAQQDLRNLYSNTIVDFASEINDPNLKYFAYFQLKDYTIAPIALLQSSQEGKQLELNNFHPATANFLRLVSADFKRLGFNSALDPQLIAASSRRASYEYFRQQNYILALQTYPADDIDKDFEPNSTLVNTHKIETNNTINNSSISATASGQISLGGFGAFGSGSSINNNPQSSAMGATFNLANFGSFGQSSSSAKTIIAPKPASQPSNINTPRWFSYISMNKSVSSATRILFLEMVRNEFISTSLIHLFFHRVNGAKMNLGASLMDDVQFIQSQQMPSSNSQYYSSVKDYSKYLHLPSIFNNLYLYCTIHKLGAQFITGTLQLNLSHDTLLSTNFTLTYFLNSEVNELIQQMHNFEFHLFDPNAALLNNSIQFKRFETKYWNLLEYWKILEKFHSTNSSNTKSAITNNDWYTINVLIHCYLLLWAIEMADWSTIIQILDQRFAGHINKTPKPHVPTNIELKEYDTTRKDSDVDNETVPSISSSSPAIDLFASLRSEFGLLADFLVFYGIIFQLENNFFSAFIENPGTKLHSNNQLNNNPPTIAHNLSELNVAINNFLNEIQLKSRFLFDSCIARLMNEIIEYSVIDASHMQYNNQSHTQFPFDSVLSPLLSSSLYNHLQSLGIPESLFKIGNEIKNRFQCMELKNNSQIFNSTPIELFKPRINLNSSNLDSPLSVELNPINSNSIILAGIPGLRELIIDSQLKYRKRSSDNSLLDYDETSYTGVLYRFQKHEINIDFTANSFRPNPHIALKNFFGLKYNTTQFQLKLLAFQHLIQRKVTSYNSNNSLDNSLGVERDQIQLCLVSHPIYPYYVTLTSSNRIYLWYTGVSHPIAEFHPNFPITHSNLNNPSRDTILRLRFNGTGNKLGGIAQNGKFFLWTIQFKSLNNSSNNLLHFYAVEVFQVHQKNAEDFLFLHAGNIIATIGIGITETHSTNQVNRENITHHNTTTQSNNISLINSNISSANTSVLSSNTATNLLTNLHSSSSSSSSANTYANIFNLLLPIEERCIACIKLTAENNNNTSNAINLLNIGIGCILSYIPLYELLLIGTSRGVVLLFDFRSKQFVQRFDSNNNNPNARARIVGIIYCEISERIITASGDGIIKVYSHSRNETLNWFLSGEYCYEAIHNNNISQLTHINYANPPHLYVSSSDGIVRYCCLVQSFTTTQPAHKYKPATH